MLTSKVVSCVLLKNTTLDVRSENGIWGKSMEVTLHLMVSLALHIFVLEMQVLREGRIKTI